MIVDKFSISNFRVVSALELVPCSTLNFIVGNNGSGKTSILEALYLCGRGRSFRHQEAGPFIKEGETETQVVSFFTDANGEHVLGVSRNKDDFLARLDREDVKRRSTLVTAFPIQLVTSQPQMLLEGEPDIRRRFLDLELFHVEHAYAHIWQSYRTVLKQRNSALRSKDVALVKSWNEQLISYGEQLHNIRQDFFNVLSERTSALLEKWQFDIPIRMKYLSGWAAGTALSDAVTSKIESELNLGYTLSGPHRSDMKIESSGQKSGKRLSRGQLKLLSYALRLAAISIVVERTEISPVLLVDDLFAELDSKNALLVINEIDEMAIQSLITCIDLPAIEIPTDSKVFHVEHGALKIMDS